MVIKLLFIAELDCYSMFQYPYEDPYQDPCPEDFH